jgi:hypothetical protein
MGSDTCFGYDIGGISKKFFEFDTFFELMLVLDV